MKKDPKKVVNPQSEYLMDVGGTLFFLLEVATGRTPRRLPKEFGDEKNRVDVDELIRLFGDKWIHPGSGGVIGIPGISGSLRKNYSDRHLRRELLKESWIKKVGDVYATNVNSLDAWELDHTIKANKNKRRS